MEKMASEALATATGLFNTLYNDVLGAGTLAADPKPKVSDGGAAFTEFLFTIYKALALIALGFVLRKSNYISPMVGAGLGEFVGRVAVPFALLKGISSLPLGAEGSGSGPAADWPVLMCGFWSKFVVFVVAAVLGGLLRKSLVSAGVFGLMVSLSNDAALGLPILNSTHPKVGSALIFLMTLPCSVLLLPLGLVMAELGKKTEDDSAKKGVVLVLINTLIRVACQPIIMATGIALTYNLATGSAPLPKPISIVLESMLPALVVSATMSLGASLTTMKMSLNALIVPLIFVCINLFGPGLVSKLSAPMFGVTSKTSIEMLSLYGALPTAPLAWAIAREHKAEVETTGAVIVIATLLCGPAMILEHDGFRSDAADMATALYASMRMWLGVKEPVQEL